MYQFLIKKGFTVSVVAGIAISVISCLLILVGVNSVPDYGDVKAVNKAMYALSSFDFGLYMMYILTVVAGLVALVLSSLYVFQNFAESKKSLIMILGGLAIFAICIALGTNTYSATKMMQLSNLGVTDGIVKFVDGSLKFMYIAFFASIIAIVGAEAYNSVKKH